MKHQISATKNLRKENSVIAETNKRRKNAILALCLLILGAYLNDLLSVEVSGIFIEPFKLSMIIGVLLCTPYVRYDVVGLTKMPVRYFYFSLIILVFILYNLSLIISLFVANNLSVARKINYLLLNAGAVVFVVSVSSAIISSRKNDIYTSLSILLKNLLFISLIVGTLQVVIGNTFFDGIGIYYDNDIIPKGVHNERLAFAELLIIGTTAYIITPKNHKINLIWKLILLTWVFTLILISGSLTGLLGLLLLTIPIIGKNINIKRIIKILVIAFIFIGVFIPIIFNNFINDRKEEFLNTKVERYFVNPEQENYRYFASLFLLNEVINNPTLLGNGYRSNAKFLVQINPSNKEESSHTFISILYDQGIIGFIVFFLMIAIQIYYTIKIFKNLKYIRSNEVFIGANFAIVFSGLTFLRFLTYYHTTHQWLYLLTFVLLYTVNRQISK